MQIHRGLKRANFAALLALIIFVGLAIAALFEASQAGHNARAAGRARQLAEQEAEQARQAQVHALLEQARAQRRIGDAGQRFGSLAAVIKAAAIAPSFELRHEAIAALALSDVRFIPVYTNTDPNLFTRFSPDFLQVAASKSGGQIGLLRVSDGSELGELPTEGGQVLDMWFSPDGRSLAVNYYGNSACVWDLSSRQKVMALEPGDYFGGFCPVSPRVLVGNNAGAVRCLVFPGGTELWRYDAGPRPVGFAVQPQEKYFATFVPNDSGLQVRKMNSGELVYETDHPSRTGTMSWSPDGRTLLVGRENGWIYSWNVESWEQTTSWKGHEDTVAELKFAPSGRWVASSSWDGAIKFWDLPGNRLAVSARGYDAHMVAKISPDGRRLACLLHSEVLGFLELETSPTFRRIYVAPGEARGAWSVDISPDGKLVAAGYENWLLLFDLASGAQLDSRPVQDCRSVLFTPDGAGLVTCGAPGIAYWTITNAADGSRRIETSRTIREGPQFLYGALSPDGRSVAAAIRSPGTVGVYNLENPADRFPLTNQPLAQTVALSGNGRWVACGTWKGRRVKVWDLSTRQVVGDLPVEESCNVAFSPDSRLLVTGARRYQVWDTATWTERYRLPEIGLATPPAAFSPDGRILAVLNAPGVVELLEPATGKPLTSLEPPGSVPISALRFGPDGSQLVALEWTRSLQIWDLRAIHEELGKLGLDWESGERERAVPSGLAAKNDGMLLEAGLPSAAGGSSAAPAQPGSTQLASAAPGTLFYLLALGGVILSVMIGVYTLRYNYRMLRSYEDVEGVVAERNHQLKAARLELLHGQKMRALGTLAAGIAHDFNNLLSVIRMSNKLIDRQAPADPEIREHVTDVEHAVLQGKSLVGSMLGYVRQGDANGEPSDACAVVESAVSLLTREFLSGITLTLELERQAPHVKVGHGRLEQVLLNLLVNASEAMQGQGKLKIVLRESSALPARPYVLRPGEAAVYVELNVIDSGPGFPPEIGDRLFEPFFTTKQSSTKPGTGLGLSLVYSIAQEDKLGLCAESAPGRGATFSVVMPAV